MISLSVAILILIESSISIPLLFITVVIRIFGYVFERCVGVVEIQLVKIQWFEYDELVYESQITYKSNNTKLVNI